MSTPHRELGALLFGEQPYQRWSAPEAELLADLAPAFPARHLAQALFIVESAGFIPERVRAAVLARSFDRDLEPEFARKAAEVLVRHPSLVRFLPVDRLDLSVIEAMLHAGTEGWEGPGRLVELVGELVSAGAAGAQDLLLRALDRAAD